MKQLLALCSLQKTAIRDGLGGAFARLTLPFYSYGFWYADGSQYTFPGAQIRQQTGMGMSGQDMPHSYQKAEGICLTGGQ